MAHACFFSDRPWIEFEVNMRQIIAIGRGGFSKYGEYSPINTRISKEVYSSLIKNTSP